MLVIDPGTRCLGWCSDVSSGHVDKDIIVWLEGIIPLMSVVYVEDYAYSRHSRSVTMLAELKGIIRYICRLHNVRYEVINISKWKSCYPLLRGLKKSTKADKAEYCRVASEYVGKVLTNVDEADACMMYKHLGGFDGRKSID